MLNLQQDEQITITKIFELPQWEESTELKVLALISIDTKNEKEEWIKLIKECI